MTIEEINNLADLFTAAGRRNVPVPIEEWKEMKRMLAEKDAARREPHNRIDTALRSKSTISDDINYAMPPDHAFVR